MPKTSFIMRFVLLISIGFLVYVGTVLAHDGLMENAAAPGSGGSGPFAALRVELLGHLEVNEIGGGGNSVFANDCWGWTDPASNRKFAIVGLTNACSFIEVTVPTNPQYLGKLDTAEAGQNTFWRDVKVYNNHAFIVADGGGNDQGIQVLDLTLLLTADPNNPSNFTATDHYNGFSRGHNIVINEDTGYGYVVGAYNNAGGRLYRGGLTMFDLSDPTNIALVGDYRSDGYTHDAQVVVYSGPDTTHVGKEVAFACNEDTLTIVDVSDKSNPTLISRNPYNESSYAHQGWLSEDQKYFYMNDETDELDNAQAGGTPFPTRTFIWDVSDLDAPVYEGFYEGTESTIDHNLYVKGNFIYQANYSSGLRILQIDPTDPTSLSEYGFFDTFMTNDNVNFDGAWSCYPYFDYGVDDVIIISDQQGGLFVVKRLPQPTVESLELNINEPQRSAVESITLTLEGDVVFAPGAVSVVQRSTATAATFENVTVNVNTTMAGGETTATIMFDSHVRNSDNVLVDGNYQLTLDAALVTRDGVPMAEDYVYGDEEADGFFCYYGDFDGDRSVGLFDLLPFRISYGSNSADANYQHAFDYNASGTIDLFDLLPFRIRFGTELPWAFTKSKQASNEAAATTTKLKSGVRRK